MEAGPALPLSASPADIEAAEREEDLVKMGILLLPCHRGSGKTEQEREAS